MTGWVSYTLSRTERRFGTVNDDSWYPANQDRTHDLSVVGIYKLSKKWTLSGDFVYYTGNAVTWRAGNTRSTGRWPFCIPSGMVTGCRLITGWIYRPPCKGKRRRSSTATGTSRYTMLTAGKILTVSASSRIPAIRPRPRRFSMPYSVWVPSVTYNFKF